MTMTSARLALLAIGVLLVLGATATVYWNKMSPGARWVFQHGGASTGDIQSLARGEIRKLGWPLIDTTLVTGQGYVVLSLHDDQQTVLLFAPDRLGLEAFKNESKQLYVRSIRGPWYEVLIR